MQKSRVATECHDLFAGLAQCDSGRHPDTRTQTVFHIYQLERWQLRTNHTPRLTDDDKRITSSPLRHHFDQGVKSGVIGAAIAKRLSTRPGAVARAVGGQSQRGPDCVQRNCNLRGEKLARYGYMTTVPTVHWQC